MTKNSVFSDDFATDKKSVVVENKEIGEFVKIISSDVSDEAKRKGEQFAAEIEERFVSDFEKSEALLEEGKVSERDFMVHVSTFEVINDVVYMTYYANTTNELEDPHNQTARFVYCPISDLANKTFVDLQSAGDIFCGRRINALYDTVLMQKDEDTLYILWTAELADGDTYNYYRLYCPFKISTQELGEISVNRFKVGDLFLEFFKLASERSGQIRNFR